MSTVIAWPDETSFSHDGGRGWAADVIRSLGNGPEMTEDNWRAWAKSLEWLGRDLDVPRHEEYVTFYLWAVDFYRMNDGGVS